MIDTLIQPGSPGFKFSIQIPTTEPPGLYWYHPHIHGFTEFQVNGGAAGAIVVEGMEKYRPEVKGLTERIFVIRQQYLVPWIPGPYQLTLNYQVAPLEGLQPVIQMQPEEKQFWRVANASLQDFLELQVLQNNKPKKLQLIALDGYPLAEPRDVEEILVPPAGRAEFIVKAPPAGKSAVFYTQAYSTGPTGNADLANTLANIHVTNGNASSHICNRGARTCIGTRTHTRLNDRRSSSPTSLARRQPRPASSTSRKNLAAPTVPSSST